MVRAISGILDLTFKRGTMGHSRQEWGREVNAGAIDLGLIPIQGGEIKYKNRSITKLKPWWRVSWGYPTFLRDEECCIPSRENLLAASSQQEIDQGADIFNYFPDLKKFIDRGSSLLSGGQQQQLAKHEPCCRIRSS